MGPTVFEAVAAGCMYLNPVYDHPKVLAMNLRMQLDSQHPQARQVLGGEPYVYDIHINDHDQVLNTVERALKNRSKVKPMVPTEYTLERVTERIAHDLKENEFCNI